MLKEIRNITRTFHPKALEKDYQRLKSFVFQLTRCSFRCRMILTVGDANIDLPGMYSNYGSVHFVWTTKMYIKRLFIVFLPVKTCCFYDMPD